jgi:hypothetical protein
MRIDAFELSAYEIVSQADEVAEQIIGTVTLDEPAPEGGVLVLIGSIDSELKVPRSALVEPGETSVNFYIGSGALLPLYVYHVYAQVQESVARQKVVLKLPGLASVAFSPNKVEGGEVSRLTVNLDSPAPATGALVLFTEVIGYDGENTPLLLDLPPSLFFASGDTTNYCDVTTRVWDGGRRPPPREINTAVDAIYGTNTKRAILTITDP